jgi:hypothetical protein
VAEKWARFLVVCLVLAGCGGGGDVIEAAGGGTGGDGAGGGSLHCALTGCEIAKLPPTSSMPAGSATYTGRASVTTTLASGALRTTNADLALSANFAARSLSVGLTNFVTGSTVYAGSAAGVGSISGNSFSAQYSGVLTAPAQGAVPISGDMTGVFRGENAAALNGEISITDGGATGGDAFGQFYANKN